MILDIIFHNYMFLNAKIYNWLTLISRVLISVFKAASVIASTLLVVAAPTIMIAATACVLTGRPTLLLMDLLWCWRPSAIHRRIERILVTSVVTIESSSTVAIFIVTIELVPISTC